MTVTPRGKITLNSPLLDQLFVKQNTEYSIILTQSCGIYCFVCRLDILSKRFYSFAVYNIRNYNMLSNFDKMCGDLEKQELEAPNGVASPSTYAQLLAIYLHQNDLCNAKFLWKRIPQNITSSNPEITAIWAVGQKLWKKDLGGTYQALSAYTWTEPLANIIRALEEKVRERTFNLIGRSYSSISLDTVVAMTGLSRDAVLHTCRDRKWLLNDDGINVSPTPPITPAPLHTSSEDQLFKLTEFVSFLEN